VIGKLAQPHSNLPNVLLNGPGPDAAVLGWAAHEHCAGHHAASRHVEQCMQARCLVLLLAAQQALISSGITHFPSITSPLHTYGSSYS
jgi:hypothetical protein